MYCLLCNSKETRVTDSRVASDGMSVRRRRECEKCGFRFSTLEEMEILDLTVVKRDGRREPYSKEKIIKGLEHSLEKLSYTKEAFSKLVHHIERDIQKRKKSEITTSEIGDIVMRRLKGYNKVAYIRFASVYRSFQDVSGFEQELKKIKKKRRRKRV